MLPLMPLAHTHATIMQPVLAVMAVPRPDFLRLFFAGDFFAADERETRFTWGEHDQIVTAAIAFGCVCEQCGKTNEHYGKCSDEFSHPQQVADWMDKRHWRTINGKSYCPTCVGRLTFRR